MSADYRQLLETAWFIARAHEGQKRKDGKTPYAAHPFRVCLIVRDLFGFDDARMLRTALLHDTIEDTTTDFDDLEETHGADVASWVAYLTKDKRLREDEREVDYLARLKEAPWQVHVCKLADIYDNLTDLSHMPKEKQRKSLKRCEQYFSELRQIANAQTKRAVDIVQKLIDEVRRSV